jgi:hypothetical protein
MLRALPSSTIVVVMSFICYAFHLGFPTVSFLFLVVVVNPLAGR